MTENANALVVDAALTRASGTAEREAALAMVGRRRKGRRITLGADRAYDMADFVDTLRALTVTPHITVDGHVTKTGKRRKTRIDRRTTRHAGYAVSQRLRKRIEEGFGWIKTTGGLDVHTDRRRLQPGPTAQTHGRGSNPMPTCRAIHPQRPHRRNAKLKPLYP